MKSLIPEHLQTSNAISLSRLHTAQHLASTITYCKIKVWPGPAKPVVQMMITILEREYLGTLQLAHSELGNLIKYLEEAKVNLTPTKEIG